MRKTVVQRFIEVVQQDKHNLALTMLPSVKRRLTVVKTLVVEYGMEDREKFIQVTVPAEGAYLLWLVVRRGERMVHRFYLKQSSKKRKGGREYNVISWRIPAELRGSRLHIKICRLE